MTLSIQTNKAALDNAQQLTKLAAQRTQNQNAIATGQAINSFKDNAAALSIANKMSGEARAYESVQAAQGFAEAVTGVASAAGQQVSELLSEARAKSVLAQTGGFSAADRQAVQNEIDSLLNQLDTTVSTASFNEVNLVDSVNGQGGQVFNSISDTEGTPIELTAPAFDRAALGLGAIDVVNDPAGALAAFDSAIEQVNTGQAALGAFANQLENAQTQVSGQIDELTAGIGAIVDANLAQEAARQTALDIRNQLQTTTSGIANAAPSVIGQLF